MKTSYFISVILLVVVIGCKEDDELPQLPVIELTYNFQEDNEGWVGDFADLPVEGQDIYELSVDHAQLPEETGSQDFSIRIQGNNRSDDLFMFLKKQISGLKPLTSYKIVFSIQLASQYPEDSFGAGGSPGGSVYLKAGASLNEPEPVLEDGNPDFLIMNIDKGNQSQEGEDMYNIGTIGIEGEEFRYELINRGNADRPFTITTDEHGSIWLIVGTDSGFEGLTVLYYNSVEVKIEEIG